MAILVLGGAGYIGSHTVYALCEAGREVVVVDNLETGHAEAVHPDAKFYKGDISDKSFLNEVFQKENIEAVIHFAAYSLVGESVENPLKYYENNLSKTRDMLEVMVANGVDKFVFSSTAATYGEPERVPFWKTTVQDQPTPTVKQNWQWKKCSNGQATQQACVMYPCVTSTPAVPISAATLGKHIIPKAI